MGSAAKRVAGLTIAAVLATGLTTVIATSLPVLEIATGTNQELRVMPPTAFPLTMQQYRDYDLHQFSYRIVIGWPDGIPIYEGAATDGQSEYIHLAHLCTAILLSGYMIAGLAVILAIVLLFAARKQKRSSSQ